MNFVRSEREITEEIRGNSLSFTPERKRYIDEQLSLKVYKILLFEMGPVYRQFLTPARKEELFEKCKRITDYTEGLFQIRVMEYSDLRYAMENDKRLILVGFPAKNSIFALIDDDARFVGVYIPMAPRQLVINQKIDKAIYNLKRFFECKCKGSILTKEVEKTLVDFLWAQQYPYVVPDIKIIASKNKLEGDYYKKVLWRNAVVQIKMDNNVAFYHVN